MRQGFTYRGDLLVNDLSLKRLCGSLPGMTGYISGRVDGIVSLAGAGKGINGMVGYVDLWARRGKREQMLVSKEFLQRLSKQKISGFFFSSDRPYDQAEITANLEGGFLSFDKLSILHTNLLGVRDLNVSIAPSQNRIELEHLLSAIASAAARGKGGAAPQPPTPAGTPAETPEFKWQE
jgi:hypothetical protein